MKKESSFETFCEWLDEVYEECGLYIMEMGSDYILSWEGSDGPDIIGEEIFFDEGSASFNDPKAVDDLLALNYYEDECEPGAPFYGHRRAPKIHYLDWFNKKYNNE